MTELSDKAREIKNAYQREWRRKNPERLKKHMADYWERKAAKASAGPVCQECGARLEDKRDGAKFCSPACRQKHYRESNELRKNSRIW
jgi:predicted RNA-binding Zn-ribbon protein involved in translation (DUF1610 family)